MHFCVSFKRHDYMSSRRYSAIQSSASRKDVDMIATNDNGGSPRTGSMALPHKNSKLYFSTLHLTLDLYLREGIYLLP